MKIFGLIAALISINSFAGSPVSCADLGKSADHYQSILMSAKIDGCGNFAPEGAPSSGPALESFNKYRCSNLSLVEQRIRSLENEEKLLVSFEQLKIKIREDQKNIGPSPTPDTLESAQGYVNGVIAAQSLQFVVENRIGEETLFEALRSRPLSERDTLSEVKAIVQGLCANQVPTENPDETKNACNADHFQPNEQAFVDFAALMAQDDVSSEQIQNWQQALQIESDDRPTSFYEMRLAVEAAVRQRDLSAVDLNADNIRALRSLPDFSNLNAPQFVRDLVGKNPGLKSLGSLAETKHTVNGLLERQALEIQSKTSFAYESLKHKFQNADLSECQSAKSDLAAAVSCMEKMEVLKGRVSDTGPIDEQLEGFHLAHDYYKKIQSLDTACFDQPAVQAATTGETLPAACLEAEALLTQDQNAISEEIRALTLVKNKMLEGKDNDIKFRNFSLSSLQDNGCGDVVQLMSCNDTDVELNTFISDATKIAMVLDTKPESNADIAQICVDSPAAVSRNFQDRLCNSLTPSENSTVTPPSQVLRDFSDPESEWARPNTQVADAWRMGFSNLLSSSAQMLIPQMASPNLYGYSSGVTMPASPPSRFSSSVFSQAGYTGYK